MLELKVKGAEPLANAENSIIDSSSIESSLLTKTTKPSCDLYACPFLDLAQLHITSNTQIRKGTERMEGPPSPQEGKHQCQLKSF